MMSFRTATPDDLATLLRMHRAFYEEEGYPYTEELFARALREVLANPALGRVLIIGDYTGYLIVAFGFSIEFGGRDAFLDELYVVPEARGQGLGTAAIDEAERVCRENDIHALHLEVEFTNESAKRLYARRGFAEHSRQLMTKRFGLS
ncbi:MAG TPA: GNAT family N-acetyltransferase [Thermoanaerobaculia bacterium]